MHLQVLVEFRLWQELVTEECASAGRNSWDQHVYPPGFIVATAVATPAIYIRWGTYLQRDKDLVAQMLQDLLQCHSWLRESDYKVVLKHVQASGASP